MNKKVLVEGALILIFTFLSIFEGIRLIIYQYNDRYTLYDMVGPGYYILSLSILLLTVTIMYFVKNYGKAAFSKKETVGKEMRIRMISMTAGFAIYILIMNLFGYLIATLFFFFFEFRAVGIKSWKTNSIVTLFMTASYYFIFIRFCNMVFPRGMLFR
jgi:hypothetical protein